MGCCVLVCVAPKGLGDAALLSSARASSSTSNMVGAAVSFSAAALAARVAASWALKGKAPTGQAPAHMRGTRPSNRKSKGTSLSQLQSALPADVEEVFESECNDDDEEEDEEMPELDEMSDEEWEDDPEDVQTWRQTAEDAPPPKATGSGKLWTKKEFPAGVTNPYNWDMQNLKAAQAWRCPCKDRDNCIGEERVCVLKLYDYRQKFRQTEAKNNGGLRDATRKELEGHYDKTSGEFTRSFVVGAVGDCCAASAGLAKGLSFQTFAEARADVTQERALRPGRNKQRRREESEQRRHFRAWIRAERKRMEGPKGGSDPVDKWRTGYLPRSKRWEMYKESRRRASQPILGSEALL